MKTLIVRLLKKKFVVIALGVLLIVGSYFVFGGGKSYGQGGFALNEQNRSGESGYAKIIEVNGQAIVDIFLNGRKSGDPAQPTSVYFGSCKNLGSPKYPLTALDDTGYSETVLGGTLDRLRAELPYAIAVQKSENDATSIVACGDIKI